MSEKFRAFHDIASVGARHERMRATLHGVIAAALVGVGQPADARITQLQITSQTLAFGGMSFGAVGQYETLGGRASGEVDPTRSAQCSHHRQCSLRQGTRAAWWSTRWTS